MITKQNKQFKYEPGMDIKDMCFKDVCTLCTYFIRLKGTIHKNENEWDKGVYADCEYVDFMKDSKIYNRHSYMGIKDIERIPQITIDEFNEAKEKYNAQESSDDNS